MPTENDNTIAHIKRHILKCRIKTPARKKTFGIITDSTFTRQNYYLNKLNKRFKVFIPYLNTKC